MNKIIISLELKLTMFEIHLVVLKELGIIYTLTVDSIQNSKEQTKIFNWIMNNNIGELIKYFKHRYDLLHTSISLSYGPQLRKILKERKNIKQIAKED